MSQDENTALAALGALLGYVGAEAATTAPFEQLLWPQRHLSNFSWRSAPAVALLMPMGGPFHKAALETFDTLHRHGLLFAGPRRGHMLGTAFFTDIGWTYNVHEPGRLPEVKETRNCLWAPAVGLLPVPEVEEETRGSPEARAEKGQQAKKAAVRARISVNHLAFSRASPDDKASNMPFVREDTKAPSLRIIAAIFVAESSAIIVAAVVAGVWRDSWALLWLAPLLLRLISAAFAVHREPLSATEPPASGADDSRDFQVHCPRSNGDFLVLTGPPAVVLQFMRHYAHPVRSRPRETLQLLVVIVLGAVFPLGLVASALFMPLPLQYVWFGYQMFLVVGLHVARYSSRAASVSTHAAIAEAFSRGGSILFGQRRHGAETIRVDLATTYHDRHADGRLAVEALLGRGSGGPGGPQKDLLAPSRSNSEVAKGDSKLR